MEEDSNGDDCEGAVFEEEKDEEDEDTDIESEEDIVEIFELFWCARHHCKKKENSSKLTYCEIPFSEYDKYVE